MATALAVLAVAAVLPSSAAATTVGPGGHSFTLGSQTVSFNINGGPTDWRCTMNAGGTTIPAYPANHNPSGPVTIPLNTRPTFSNCGLYPPGYTVPLVSMNVDTGGTWGIEFQSGVQTANIKIPVNGIRFWYTGCNQLNTTPLTLPGTWQNGTVPPPQIKSVFTTGPATIPFGTGCGVLNFTGGVSYTVTNTTVGQYPFPITVS